MSRMMSVKLLMLLAVIVSLGCSKTTPDITSQPNPIPAFPLQPSVSFEPLALQEIHQIAREQQLDWSEVVIYLSAGDRTTGLSEVNMTFERRDKFPTESNVFTEFDGIPVVISKDHLSQFQNVRVRIGERNGKRGFLFHASPKKHGT